MPRERKVVPAEAFLTFDPPPARAPRPVTATDQTRGHRLVLIHPDGYVYDQRAMGNPRQGPIDGVTDDTDDRFHLAVVSEYDWYRWLIDKQRPAVQWWPLETRGTQPQPLVYLE